jgi:hypothetical protein
MVPTISGVTQCQPNTVTADHLIPVKECLEKGMEKLIVDPHNIVISCHKCNIRRGYGQLSHSL